MNPSEDNEDGPFSFELVVAVHVAKNNIQRFLEFSSEIEDTLDFECERLYSKIELALAANPNLDDEEIVESYAEDLHEREVLFPSIHRESLFVTLYGRLEYEIETLTAKLGSETGSTLAPRDLSGKGLNRSFAYLEKVVDFRISSETRNYLLGANRLRNIIVHAGGQLPDEPNDSVHHFINSAGDTLHGSPGHLVHLETRFVKSFAQRVVELFEEIESEMQRKIRGNA